VGVDPASVGLGGGGDDDGVGEEIEGEPYK
jgi:hypothetical protein